MNESFLHYIWQFQLLNTLSLTTINNESITVINAGQKNTNAGPDFLNAKIRIGHTIWAGNIEIHVNASDWKLHGHSGDKNYHNIILHVVYTNDLSIKILEERNIPTIEIKPFIKSELFKQYNQIVLRKEQFIPCETLFYKVDQFKKENFLNQLLVERLENKAEILWKTLEKTQDWEVILFRQLSAVFGLKINKEAMLNWSKSFDFKLVKQYAHDDLKIEALFLGQAGFLTETINNPYTKNLKSEYYFLKLKHNLTPLDSSTFKFLRLRPQNFPTVRIIQLASLYSNNPKLFSRIIHLKDLKKIQTIFENCNTNQFWDNHYTLKKSSEHFQPKKISKEQVQLIILNCVIPVKFTYHKTLGKESYDDILLLYQKLNAEKNKIIKKFTQIKAKIHNAADSQAHLQLYNNYCKEKNCLNCRIGYEILSNV